MRNETEFINLIKAPLEDKNFPKKFVIATLATLGSVLLLPGLTLLGFLARVVKMKREGKKGLPEWGQYQELTKQGASYIPTMIYVLPGSIVIAIAIIANTSGPRTFLGVSLLSTFIMIGGLLLTFLGLAVALTAIHTYLHSGKFVDLFAVPQILKKLTTEAVEMAKVFGAGTCATLVFLTLNVYLGSVGTLVSVLGSAFMGLSLAGAVGSIYGRPESSPVETAETPVEENLSETDEDWLPDSDSDEVWKPS